MIVTVWFVVGLDMITEFHIRVLRLNLFTNIGAILSIIGNTFVKYSTIFHLTVNFNSV